MEGKNQSFKVMPKQVVSELPQDYTLSPEQLQFYKDQGYFVVKGLIDFTSLYAYKQRFIQIAKGIVDKGNITVVKEPALIKKGAKGEDLINKLQDILFDDIFSQYTEHPRLLHVVSQVIGDDLTAMHTMFINKPPGATRHPPHQDLYYFPFRPADKILAAWTAVDEVTLENGALYVVPGSHTGKMHEHGTLEDMNKLYHGILSEATVAPLSRRVNLEMSPGDTVFFHPLLVHGSGPNTTKYFRKSISCHFANSSCHYAALEPTQERLAEEIETEAARRGFRVSFQEIWQYRSKQVKGVKSNL